MNKRRDSENKRDSIAHEFICVPRIINLDNVIGRDILLADTRTQPNGIIARFKDSPVFIKSRSCC